MPSARWSRRASAEAGFPSQIGVLRVTVIDTWQVAALRAGPVRIFPDGCQDVIWVKRIGCAPCWKRASLDPQVRVLRGAEGAAMRGFRLAPGVCIPEALFSELDAERPDETAAIAGLCRRPPALAEMMAELAFAPSGAEALARRLGQSLRSLQRLSRSGTGQPPLFWLRLSRLRRAMALAAAGTPLAGAAADAGFADQAHFTREARHFHGASPGRLLVDAEAMAAILSAGL